MDEGNVEMMVLWFDVTIEGGHCIQQSNNRIKVGFHGVKMTVISFMS